MKLKIVVVLSLCISNFAFAQNAKLADLLELKESNAIETIKPRSVNTVSNTNYSNSHNTNNTYSKYQVRLSDKTFQGVMNRWLSKNNINQRVVWELSQDIPIDKEVTYEGNLNEAINELMKASKYALPIRTCIYTNKVYRVIPRTKFCENQ